MYGVGLAAYRDVGRRRRTKSVRLRRAWTALPRLRVYSASGAEEERRCADRGGALAVAVARTNPPQSTADKMPAIVSASNIMVILHGLNDDNISTSPYAKSVPSCYGL
jgi:hypothetical protein